VPKNFGGIQISFDRMKTSTNADGMINKQKLFLVNSCANPIYFKTK
jgi:hypothetical protein